MSLIKSYFRIYSVPNPRAWLNAHLKSPDVVIFDQKHSIKPLKLCFPCYLSWISSFFPLSLPVTILLFRLIFSAILFIILYILLLSAFIFSLLCLHPFFLPVFSFLPSFLPRFTAVPTGGSAVFILYLFFLSAFCLYFYPVLQTFFFWLYANTMGHNCILS